MNKACTEKQSVKRGMIMQGSILEASEEMDRIIILYMKGEVSKEQVEELRQQLHSSLEFCK